MVCIGLHGILRLWGVELMVQGLGLYDQYLFLLILRGAYGLYRDVSCIKVMIGVCSGF